MSQYPSPYSPPPGGYPQQMYWDPARDLLAPARRASILMFVYGGLMLLCGGCTLANAAFLRSPETVRQVRESLPNLELPSPRETAISAAVLLVTAIGFIALGAWVRNGRRGALITSMVFVGLILLYQAGGLILSVAAGADPAALGISLCFSVVLVIAPMVLLLVWLIQALRNSRQVDGAQAYAQQYWQYAQQYQQQQGYPPPPPGQAHGYGQEGSPPMIPAPPPPPAPPPSSSSEEPPREG